MNVFAALLPLPVRNYALVDRCIHFWANCCGFSSNKHDLSPEHAQIKMEGYGAKFVAGDVGVFSKGVCLFMVC